MPENKPRLVATGVAAKRYSVSNQTVRRWIAAGRITAYRVGPKLIRVDLDEIDAKVMHEIPTVDFSDLDQQNHPSAGPTSLLATPPIASAKTGRKQDS